MDLAFLIIRPVVSARACRAHAGTEQVPGCRAHVPQLLSPAGRSWHHLPPKCPVAVIIATCSPMAPTQAPQPWPHAIDLATPESLTHLLSSSAPPPPPAHLPTAPSVCQADFSPSACPYGHQDMLSPAFLISQASHLQLP